MATPLLTTVLYLKHNHILYTYGSTLLKCGFIYQASGVKACYNNLFGWLRKLEGQGQWKNKKKGITPKLKQGTSPHFVRWKGKLKGTLSRFYAVWHIRGREMYNLVYQSQTDHFEEWEALYYQTHRDVTRSCEDHSFEDTDYSRRHLDFWGARSDHV